MNYQKPEVQHLGSAAVLVEGNSKEGTKKDAQELPTAAAYEAEE